MAAAFPAATKSFTTKIDGAGNTISASHINDLQDEVVAVEDWLRSTQGTWATPTFSAGNFTASGAMTWTVAEGAVGTLAYTVIGKTMVVVFALTGTTVGGTPSTALKIAIPGGYVAAKRTVAGTIVNNTTNTNGFVQVTADGVTLDLYKNADAGDWTAGACGIYGEITFGVK